MAPSWVSTSLSVYYKVKVTKRNKLLKPISTVFTNNNNNNNNNNNGISGSIFTGWLFACPMLTKFTIVKRLKDIKKCISICKRDICTQNLPVSIRLHTYY